MQKVILDLLPGGVAPIVYASQNDDKRTIRFELVSGGDNDVYVLSGNETITAKITKPDGTAITIPITNPGSGKHYVDLVNGSSDYDQDGVYLGEVSITKGEKVLGTGNFVLKAEADPYDGGVQRKIVIDNPATFSTSLPDVLVSCKCKIDDANGIDSMDVINAGPTYARDSVPYQLRQTPITANRTLEKLIGVSCAFNQLAKTSDLSTLTNNGITFTPSSSGISIQGQASALASYDINVINYTKDHKYAVLGIPQGANSNGYYLFAFATDQTNDKIINALNTDWFTLRIRVASGTNIDNPILFKPNIIDLTACFGSEVADYLYTLESGTAGSGIALFKQLFPDDYYAYQTATLISSKPTSKVIYDSNNNVIATYPLGGDELRGLLKVENGQLVAYGDIHPSDGNGTEVFDIVDLGSLTWNMSSGNFFCQDAVIGRKANALALCGGGYIQVAETSPSGLDVDKAFAFQSNVMTRLIIRDTAYANETDFKTHLQNDGVYLIYEKATPTAKSYTPFTNPMICGLTEEFTDSRSLKMFCGHDSIYADNISFAHIDFGQTVTDGTLDVVHGILTPTGGSPVSVTPASIKTFSGVNNVFSNGGGDITAIYLDTL